MAFKSEFAEWREELEPPPRPTIAERVARWFDRTPAKPPEPDFYVWHDLASFVPVASLQQKDGDVG